MKTAKGGKIHGQSRLSILKERNLVQTDLTPKGKDAGAKLGKVSSVALDSFLGGMGIVQPNDKNIPPVGQWTDSAKRYWINLYKKLDSSGMVDFGEVAVYENNKKVAEGFEAVLDYAIIYETKKADRSSAGRFSSKLVAMDGQISGSLLPRKVNQKSGVLHFTMVLKKNLVTPMDHF